MSSKERCEVVMVMNTFFVAMALKPQMKDQISLAHMASSVLEMRVMSMITWLTSLKIAPSLSMILSELMFSLIP